MGVYQSIARLGSTFSMLIGGFLTPIIGYSATFIMFGVLGCVAPVLASREMMGRGTDGVAVDSEENPQPAISDDENKPDEEKGDTEAPAPSPYRSWKVVVACLTGFSNRLVIDGTFSSILGYTLKTRYGDNPDLFGVSVAVVSMTGALLSARGVVEMLAAAMIGSLGDRWGRHNVVITTLPIAGAIAGFFALKVPVRV